MCHLKITLFRAIIISTVGLSNKKSNSADNTLGVIKHNKFSLGT